MTHPAGGEYSDVKYEHKAQRVLTEKGIDMDQN